MSRKKSLHKRLDDLFENLQEETSEAEAVGIAPETIQGWGWHCDAQGRYTACDSSITSLLGYPLESIVGQPVDTFALNSASQLAVRQALQQPESAFPQEIEVVFQDSQGAARNALFHITNRTPDGSLHGFVRLQNNGTAPQPRDLPVRALPQTSELRLAASRLTLTAFPKGVRSDGARILPAGSVLSPAGLEALQQGQPVAVTSEEGAALAVPLEIAPKNALLEAIDPSPDRVWSSDDQRLAEQIAEQLALALENAQLFQTAQRRASELEALHQLTTAVTRSLDINAIFSEALDQLRDMLDVEGGLVVEASSSHPDILKLIAHWNLPDPMVQNFEARGIPVQGTPCGYAYTRGDLVSIADLEDPPEDVDISHWIEAGFPFRSYVGIAITYQEENLGTLCLLRKHAHETTPHEERLLRTIVGQIATAVANARLFQQTKEALETTDRLFQATAAFNATTTYNNVLHILREYLGEQVHTVILNLFDRPWTDQDPPNWISPLGYSTTVLPPDKHPQSLTLQRHPLSAFPAIPPLKKGLFVSDASEQPAWYKAALKINPNIPETNAMALVPLHIGGRWIGFLHVLYSQVTSFSQAERQFIQTIASQAGVAIENLRSLETAQRYAHDLETAAITASEIAAASQDLQTLLTKSVNLIRERFGFYHASVFLIDESGSYAVVQASTGKAGEEMLQRKHRLLVGSRSTVGQAAAQREPVIINDTQQSKIHRPNPLLPNTRAEAAIPLIAGERLIGILDVQSVQANAFTPEAVRMLRLLATQLAVAVENTQAYEVERQALEEMRRADELKSQFLANMSHELRTPLNSIIGFSRVILKGIDGPITETQQQDLTAIYNAGQHLLGLINDILDLSKIEAGKMELAFEEVDIADLVNSVMSTAVGLVKDKPVKLKKDIQEDLPLIHADPIRVRQVLLNLVSNAAKFTEKGYIEIFARMEKGPHGLPEILVGVKDTGPGIPPEAQNKLFKPFSQVDASPTRKTGGTGLGLSISRNLVEMHGGRIWVESEVGKGSTFYFTLPAIQAPQSATDKGERIILAIDDERDIIHLYQRYLTPLGYRVVPLTDPHMAVARARELKPSAILLDIMMPGRDGWQVLQDLKKHSETKAIPVIIASILEKHEKGFSLGAADYITKPINEEDLVRALRQVDPEGQINNILVVEDDDADRHLITRLLNEVGTFTISTAKNGEEALQRIHEQRPDAIILDLLLPDLDGFSVLEEVRAIPAWQDIPIIVFTAADLSPADLARLHAASQALVQKGAQGTEALLQQLQQLLQRVAPRQKDDFASTRGTT